MTLRKVCDSHIVAAEALAMMRNEQTPPPEFARQLHRLSLILATEATRLLPQRLIRIQTPLAECFGTILNGQHAIAPVMRAGAGMLDAFRIFLPDAVIWHVSVARDEKTFAPIFKDSKVPQRITGIDTCLALDPMLATGGSACFTVSHIKNRGACKIIFVGVIGCPQGLERLQTEHPDIDIILGEIDPELTPEKMIKPGLGDAGDRYRPTVPWKHGSLAERLGMIDRD